MFRNKSLNLRSSQPDLQTLDKIAELLECDTRVLITSKFATEL